VEHAILHGIHKGAKTERRIDGEGSRPPNHDFIYLFETQGMMRLPNHNHMSNPPYFGCLVPISNFSDC
jgi:hypothetical protein